MSNIDPVRAIEPLTRNRKNGDRYERPEQVEAEIERVLELPLHEAFRLASSGGTRAQTLVYLLRRFRPNRPNAHYDAMVEAFFARLDRGAARYLPGIPAHLHERAQGIVRDKVLAWWDTDRMDILECGFASTVERLYLTARDTVMTRATTEVAVGDLGEDDGGTPLLRRASGDTAMPLAEARAELANVMAALKPGGRRAIWLVEGLGMTEKEAGAAMGCTDRNVRHLLKQARETARAREDDR